MKKIFTTLFATAAVFCASATTPTFTVKPVDGTVLDNKVQEVTFTFSESVTVTKIGFASGPLNQRQFSVDDKAQTGKTIKAQILESYWGKAQDGEISMQVLCMDVLDAKGDTIMNADGYPEQFIVNYSYKEAASGASFVSVWPAEGEYSAADMYGTGADFYFTDEVVMTNEDATALITYTVGRRTYESKVPSNDVWEDWDWWTGNYALSVPIPEIDGVSASDVSNIKIQLQGITTLTGNDVTVPLVTYSTVSSQRKASPSTASQLDLNISSNEQVDVYSISGVCVLKSATYEDLKNLENGIYIINGKKFIVK